jgi:diguanylate cyclase (GGDEF)-like protein
MNRHRIFDSIVTRLLVLGLCIVVVGAALLYYTLSRFLREDMGAVVASQQLSLANYIASDVEQKIVQRQRLLEQLSAELPAGLLKQPQALQAWLQQRYEYQPLFKGGIFIADARGVALADYPALPNRRDASYADRDYIQAGMAGLAYVGKPVVGRAVREPVIPIAVPKKNAKGEVIAVLAGITPLADPGFLDLLLRSRIGMASGGFLLVSPRDQIFVASSQPDMVLKPTPPTGVNLLHDRAMAGHRGTGITVNAKGVEEISAMVSVPSTGWFVVARLPTREAFATVERTQRFLLQMVLLILLAYLVFSAIGLYLLFRPVFSAAEQAHRMSQGEAPFVPLPVVRQDEIGYLVSAFNRLLSRLNDKQAELAHMAHYDPLTGLPNRTLLYDRLRQVLAQARRRNTRVGVLFMDLDDFKGINDTLGHEAGDEALRQIATRFSAIAREADTLARVGGDEFVLVLADLQQDAEAVVVAVARKYIQALQLPLQIAGVPCTLGISVGITLGQGEHTPDALMQAADQAMYQAKAAGRNQYVIA